MVNEELLFRGLPWGINIDEARALLNLPDLESLQLKMQFLPSILYMAFRDIVLQLLQTATIKTRD